METEPSRTSIIKGLISDLLNGRRELEEVIGELLSEREDFILLEELINSFELNSPDLLELQEYILYFFYIRPKLKLELQKSLDNAILNMILFSKGNFTWEITNNSDLLKVLEFWKSVGMDQSLLSPERFFDLLRKKYNLRIIQGEWRLLSRIRDIFPEKIYQKCGEIAFNELKQVFFVDEFIHKKLRLDIYHSGLEDLLFLDGLFGDKLTKKIIRSIQKNCVVCGTKKNLEVHHLIPVSCGGTNHLHNLLVICNLHHSLIHKKGSSIEEWPSPACD